MTAWCDSHIYIYLVNIVSCHDCSFDSITNTSHSRSHSKNLCISLCSGFQVEWFALSYYVIPCHTNVIPRLPCYHHCQIVYCDTPSHMVAPYFRMASFSKFIFTPSLFTPSFYSRHLSIHTIFLFTPSFYSHHLSIHNSRHLSIHVIFLLHAIFSIHAIFSCHLSIRAIFLFTSSSIHIYNIILSYNKLHHFIWSYIQLFSDHNINCLPQSNHLPRGSLQTMTDFILVDAENLPEDCTLLLRENARDHRLED